MKPVSQNSPLPQPVQRPQVPAIPVKVAAAERSGDTLEIGTSPRVEADLSLAVVNGSICANGTINVKRSVIDGLIRSGLKNSKAISEPKISFDEKLQAFAVSAKVNVKGIQVPFSLNARPYAQDGKIGILLENVKVPLGGWDLSNSLLTKTATKQFADALTGAGLYSKVNDKPGVIEMEPNAIIRQLNVLPDFLSLDRESTRYTAEATKNGDLRIGLSSSHQGPALSQTPESDVSLRIDAQTMQLAMRQLVPQYQVTNLTLSPDNAKIEGKAKIEDANAVIDGGFLLINLLAVLAGGPNAAPGMPEPADIKVKVNLDVQFNGTELTITPDTNLALGPIANGLKKSGFNPIQEGQSVRVKMDEILKNQLAKMSKDPEMAHFDKVNMTPEGLEVNMRVDLDEAIEKG